MPLIHKPSKKAFTENLKTELEHGKPKDEALAISYATQRRAKRKKMADGGKMTPAVGAVPADPNKRSVNDSIKAFLGAPTYAEGGTITAKSERRPMPDNTYNDTKQKNQNSNMKPARNDGWTDTPTETQAKMNSSRGVKPIKRPKIVQGSNFKVKPHDELQDELHTQESDFQESEAPANPATQPNSMYDERNEQHTSGSPDMDEAHSTHRKPYADGGQVEESDYRHTMNKYEDDLTDLPPSHDEGSQMAMDHDEEGPDRQGPAVSDEERQHNSGMKPRLPYAEGGHIQYEDAEGHNSLDMDAVHDEHSSMLSDDQPMTEADEEKASSIAAAIMRRRKMANGGIASHESIYAHPDADQADLSRNADEDANEEDQTSFNALRKENYDESQMLRMDTAGYDQDGDSREDDRQNEHDDSIVSQIRKKMKSRSPITR